MASRTQLKSPPLLEDGSFVRSEDGSFIMETHPLQPIDHDQTSPPPPPAANNWQQADGDITSDRRKHDSSTPTDMDSVHNKSGPADHNPASSDQGSDRVTSAQSRGSVQGPDQVDRQETDVTLPESPDHILPDLSDADDDAEIKSLHDNQDYRDVYTPALPAGQDIERAQYDSPPPIADTLSQTGSQTELLSPRKSDPLVPIGSEEASGYDSDLYPSEKMVPLPPIGNNRVVPMVEEAPQHYAGTQAEYARPTVARKYSERDLLHPNYRADQNTDGAGCCGWVLYIFSILLITITLPFSLMFTIKVVQEYERAVIFRLGRLPSGGAKGPGIFFIIPCIESYSKVDLRTVSFDVPPQEVLTKDSVTVSVDAVVYYRVSNPTVSVANVENAHHSTRLLAQTTLRNILGTKNMSEILSDREAISHGMQSTLDEATDRWGIKVERVEIKDVRLPVQLQRAMAAEAEASREARAKVIAAEGEQKASKALKEAADVMCQSSAALQLRYLQTLNSISAEKNSTIIFPLPIDLLSTFLKRGK